MAGEYKTAADEAKTELEEFQEGSRELEHELESQLEQAEAKMKEIRSLLLYLPFSWLLYRNIQTCKAITIILGCIKQI